jgi:hypothetical protein
MGDNTLDWDPTERDAWVPDAQRWVCRINGVRECKIDLDDEGEIAGVHVVAGMEREPRHIVRDVEGLLKTRLGMDVYYKKIGVVQMVDEAHDEADDDEPLIVGAPAAPAPMPAAAAPAPEPPRPAPEGPPPAPAAAASAAPAAVLLAEELAPRIRCAGVGVMTAETLVRAEVRLRAGDVEARGAREVPNHLAADVVAVAEATLDALGELVADPLLLHLNEIRTETVGGKPVVLVAVDLVEGRRSETLFGTCRAEHNRQQSIVFAVLDALNRRLSLHALKSAEGADA